MNLYQIIYIFILYLLLLQINTKRYYYYYPSINTNLLSYGLSYPNNEAEIPIIINNYINKRKKTDIDFFLYTDQSIIPAFQRIIPNSLLSKSDIKNILFSGKIPYIIFFYKIFYNRARPGQVAPKILNHDNGTLLKSKTAFTPAYPSGHAFQSYYLARTLSIKFPEYKNKLIYLAKRISDIRILAGLHFPSDRDFAWWLVDRMF